MARATRLAFELHFRAERGPIRVVAEERCHYTVSIN